MRILVDMNLSPSWAAYLAAEGFEAAHWSMIGNSRAKDSQIMEWARERGYVVLTHDLDFSTLIALAGSRGPSVVQARAQAVLPESMGPRIVGVLRDYRETLSKGAIITVDLSVARVRILPVRGGVA